jgi:hypothetical protein
MIQSEFIGGQELLEALKALREGVAGDKSNLVKNALNKAGRDVLADMKANAPVSDPRKYSAADKRAGRKPGRLRDALKKQVHPRPRYLNEIVGVGVDLGRDRDDPKGAYYGAIVEFRTGWMRDRFESERHKNLRTIQEALTAGIIRVAKKVGNKNAQEVAARVQQAQRNSVSNLLAYRSKAGPGKPIGFRELSG